MSSPLLGKDPSLADAQQMDAKGLTMLGLSSWEKRRLRGDVVSPYSFLRRGSAEGAADLFSSRSSSKICGNGLKLHQDRFRLDIMKLFFTGRVVRHWNTFSREVVNTSRLSVPKKVVFGQQPS